MGVLDHRNGQRDEDPYSGRKIKIARQIGTLEGPLADIEDVALAVEDGKGDELRGTRVEQHVYVEDECYTHEHD